MTTNTTPKPVWLTFSLDYRKPTPFGYWSWGTQRFALKFKSESEARCNWINNFGLDTSINHCGRFSKNTIVLNEDGECIKNDHLMTDRELIRFHQTLLGGIQIGKKVSKLCIV